MKPYLSKLIISIALVSFFFPLIANGFVVRIENPLEADTFWEFIDKIIDAIFNLSLVIAPIIIIVAGFHFITAMGQPEKINTAKKIILWTLIGLLIVISAKGLVRFFREIFDIGPV